MFQEMMNTLVLLISFVVAVKSFDYSPSCRSHYSFNYHYADSYLLQRTANQIIFNFSLIGPSDGHVRFSQVMNPTPRHTIFEVVIGAGGNKYSAIRTKPRTKQAPDEVVTTENVLSTREFRDFQVRITTDRLELYSGGKLQPLISVTNPILKNIKYVSFSAWTNVGVVYIFDCLTASELPPQTTKDRWRRYFLSDYDSRAVPAVDGSLDVETSLDLRYVNLNAKSFQLTSYARFYLKWIDPRLQWTPRDYDNLRMFTFPANVTWLPTFSVYNGEMIEIKSGLTHIQHDGLVSWSPFYEIKSFCEVDLSSWPHDTHMCGVSIEVKSDQVQLIFTSSLDEIQTVAGLDWTVKELTSETIYRGLFNDTVRSFQLNLTLQRNLGPFFVIFTLSIIVIMGVTCCGFFLPATSTSRITLHGVTLIILTLFLQLEDKFLPALPPKTPFIIQATSALHFITACQTIFSVFASTLVQKKTPPPSPLIKLATHSWTKFLLLRADLWAEEDGNFRGIPEDACVVKQWLSVTDVMDRVAQLITVCLLAPLFYYL